MRLKKEIQEIAGIIIESEESIKEKYKNITDQEIDDMIDELKTKALRPENYRLKRNIAGISNLLGQLKEIKEQYNRLSMKGCRTGTDLEQLENLELWMQQIWLYYLKMRDYKRNIKI